MAIFIVLWPYLLTIKLRCLQKNNFGHANLRALALHILKTLLNQCKYKEAMTILRKQRINLNVIVDHDPGLFKNNVGKFLEDIPNGDKLCVFIADLM